MRMAEYYQEKKQLPKRLEVVMDAKKFAVVNNSSDAQIFGIRKVKVELHCLLNQKEFAYQEIEEVRENKMSATDENKEFGQFWIETLLAIVDKYFPKGPSPTAQ